MPPSGWTRWIDDSEDPEDDYFYWNYMTNDYSMGGLEDDECEWEQHESRTYLARYWYNTRTKKSQWDPPCGGAPVDPAYITATYQMQAEMIRMAHTAAVVPSAPDPSLPVASARPVY